MQIPAGNFAAYLFDCDGTLADSLALHFRAWNEALAPWGGNIPRDLFFAWSGMPVGETVARLNEKFGWQIPLAPVAAAREKLYLELLPAVQPVPEVAAVARAAAGKLPMAVVSGSPRASVERTLNYLGLREIFPVVVGGDDTSRGKPHPDPFLLAAARLGVGPTRCLVFEDAELGIQAASAAGMRSVRVPPRF